MSETQWAISCKKFIADDSVSHTACIIVRARLTILITIFQNPNVAACAVVMVENLETRRGWISRLMEYSKKKILEWVLAGIELVKKPVMFIMERISKFWNRLEAFVQKRIMSAAKLSLKMQ
mgnify:CR=1 FL=1